MPLASSPSFYRESPPSLTEKRTGIGGDTHQLSLYHVDTPVKEASLRVPHLMYYGIVEGKARVESGEKGAAVGSGESLVVPPLQSLRIDFPRPRHSTVTYVALRVDRETVREILGRIDDHPLGTSAPDQWRVEEETYCHVDYREGIDYVLNMIGYLFREAPPNRDQLIDLNTQELLIQMLQTRSRPLLVGEFSRQTANGGLAAAVQHIHQNLDRHISIDELVEEACMSKSTFYRHFSNEFNMSPLEYISQKRVVRARELLSDPASTVTSVGHALGFSSTSHFIDMFKEHEGMTPKQYQLEVTE